MFDSLKIGEDVSPEACRDLVERAAAASGDDVVLLIADQPGLELEAICAALSATKRSVTGAVFPALIAGERLMTHGAIACGFKTRARRLVIRNLFEPAPLLESAVQQLMVDPRESRGHTLLVFVDGQAAGSASALLDALRTPFLQLGTDFIGGGAGYWSMGTRACLFTEQEVLPTGAGIVMRFDQRTKVHVEHGWSRLAGPFYASKTRDTTVFELDWRPAIDVYEEVLGGIASGSIRGEAFPAIAKLYPIAVLKLRDHLVVRDPMTLTDEGGLFTMGLMPESSLVAVLRSEPEGLLVAASAAASGARRSVEASGKKPQSALVFDCVSRTEALGDRFEEELRRIQREMERPVVGALTLGEIASRGEAFVDFYNKTVVVGAR